MTVGLVRVLFVSVSVVARPTNVSVLVGSVSVPVLTMVVMFGLVRVNDPDAAAIVPVALTVIVLF